MKKDRILNPHILEEIAALGHTECLCIADCGLPVPKGVRVVDISLTAGIPRFMDVLRAVNTELVTEQAVVASEIDEVNPKLMEEIAAALPGLPVQKVPHEEFKSRIRSAKCVIRTGETSSYANVILIGGVNF